MGIFRKAKSVGNLKKTSNKQAQLPVADVPVRSSFEDLFEGSIELSPMEPPLNRTTFVDRDERPFEYWLVDIGLLPAFRPIQAARRAAREAHVFQPTGKEGFHTPDKRRERTRSYKYPRGNNQQKPDTVSSDIDNGGNHIASGPKEVKQPLVADDSLSTWETIEIMRMSVKTTYYRIVSYDNRMVSMEFIAPRRNLCLYVAWLEEHCYVMKHNEAVRELVQRRIMEAMEGLRPAMEEIFRGVNRIDDELSEYVNGKKSSRDRRLPTDRPTEEERKRFLERKNMETLRMMSTSPFYGECLKRLDRINAIAS